MALNIKDPVTEKLAAEVSALTGETKTGAIRTALRERRERLGLRIPRRDRKGRLLGFLEDVVWPEVPAAVRGRRLTRKEKERILGYGPDGV
jgi:antitoxin VapB